MRKRAKERGSWVCTEIATQPPQNSPYLVKLNIETHQCALFCHKGENAPRHHTGWTSLGGQEEEALRRNRAWEWSSGAPKGSLYVEINLRIKEHDSWKQPWRWFQTTQFTDQKPETRVEMTRRLSWLAWSGTEQPASPTHHRRLPARPESVLGITTGLLIEISVWSQIPSNHNSVLEPAGKPPNLSLGFQFCQGKCEKYHQEQPQC